LTLSKLPAIGSVQVTPPDDTKYVLTVNGPGGSDSKYVTASLYAPPAKTQGSWWYFKMTNPQSQVTPCFTVAVFADTEAHAKQVAEAQNGGFGGESQFTTACP
jgi:hypothetical protein